MNGLLSMAILTGMAFIFSPTAHAEKLLVVGESHTCGPFGQNLLRRLTEAGNEVTLYCTPSSAPANWIKGTNPQGHSCSKMTSASPAPVPCKPIGENGKGLTPRFSFLLEKFPTSRVIVALGTNTMDDTGFRDAYGEMIQLIKKAKAPCDWIGPPYMDPSHPSANAVFGRGNLQGKNDGIKHFYTQLKCATKNTCDVVDSRDFTASGSQGFSTEDGCHRTEKAGAFWAGSISNSLIKTQAAYETQTSDAERED